MTMYYDVHLYTPDTRVDIELSYIVPHGNVIIHRFKDMIKYTDWCKQHVGGNKWKYFGFRASKTSYFFRFTRKDDAIAFRLKFRL